MSVDDDIVVGYGTALASSSSTPALDTRSRRLERTEDMPPETVESRVDRLEHRVTELEKLPDRLTAVESQIVQLRTEMRGEFSAVRQEIRDGDQETRHVLRQEIEATRRDLTGYIETVRTDLTGQIEALRADLTGQIGALRHEFTGQIEETRRHMRVLHEDVIGRLAIIQEGQSPRRRKR